MSGFSLPTAKGETAIFWTEDRATDWWNQRMGDDA